MARMNMTATQRAVQAALAAEIGARLGYAHRTQTWLQGKAGFSAKSWQRWFKHCDRDVSIGVLIDIAKVLDVPASELLAAAQEKSHLFEPRFMGLTEDEQTALEAAMEEKSPPETPPLRSVDKPHAGSA